MSLTLSNWRRAVVKDKNFGAWEKVKMQNYVCAKRLDDQRSGKRGRIFLRLGGGSSSAAYSRQQHYDSSAATTVSGSARARSSAYGGALLGGQPFGLQNAVSITRDHQSCGLAACGLM